MNKQDFLKQIKDASKCQEKIESVSNNYKADLEETLENLISQTDEIGFIEDDIRLLAFSEICNPKELLGYDFILEGLIPIFDIFDNTYVVYEVERKKWARFNISDEILYKENDCIENVLP